MATGFLQSGEPQWALVFCSYEVTAWSCASVQVAPVSQYKSQLKFCTNGPGYVVVVRVAASISGNNLSSRCSLSQL